MVQWVGRPVVQQRLLTLQCSDPTLGRCGQSQAADRMRSPEGDQHLLPQVLADATFVGMKVAGAETVLSFARQYEHLDLIPQLD